MKKLRQLIYVLLFMSFLVGSFIYIVFIQTQTRVSINENRNLVTNENVLNASFDDKTLQTTIESLLSDQFPKRNDWVSYKKNLDLKIVRSFVKIDNLDFTLSRMGDADRFQVGDSDYLIYEVMVHDEKNEDKILRRIDQINQFQKDHPNVNMYIYRPIQPHEMNLFDDANEIESYGKQYNDLFKEKATVDVSYLEINDLDTFKEYYYKGDHHWNYKGSYKGYVDMINMIKPSDKPLLPTGVYCKDNSTFYGTHSNFSGRIFGGDEMCVYTFDYETLTIYAGDEVVDDIHNPNAFHALKELDAEGYLYGDAYSAYVLYNGNAYSKFVTNNEENGKILVVGDSFISPIAHLLASHFYETYYLVPSYDIVSDPNFSYDEFIEEHDIDTVLFMYTIENYFYEDEWGEIYKNFDVKREGE